jgi:isopentenyl diphosphate isomerase/L-lactate dehydrogenase-like FMN-dependent dehydrogenase
MRIAEIIRPLRRGNDIAAALALGARAVLAGRAHLYGLAAAGEAGVRHCIGSR